MFGWLWRKAKEKDELRRRLIDLAMLDEIYPKAHLYVQADDAGLIVLDFPPRFRLSLDGRYRDLETDHIRKLYKAGDWEWIEFYFVKELSILKKEAFENSPAVRFIGHQRPSIVSIFRGWPPISGEKPN